MRGDAPFWRQRAERPPLLSQSPVTHLLSCDAYPTAADSRRVQDVIADAKLHLSSLQQAIERVQGMLQELKDSKNQLSAYIKAHEAVIAPIRRINDDVLVEIFMHCLPPPYEALPDPMKAPLLLTRVCQRRKLLGWPGHQGDRALDVLFCAMSAQHHTSQPRSKTMSICPGTPPPSRTPMEKYFPSNSISIIERLQLNTPRIAVVGISVH
ncbi:hypothetical protein AX14_010030 [Amanita brunnescens Koide BX004]|nr:hypothetical protein AX14_010030 [Amanita brunnescens Koide BX004]